MVQLTESDMQLDHARWCNDYAEWLEVVELWEARHDEAIAELRRLFVFIRALRHAVRSHGDTIGAYECVCRHHVQEISGDCGAAAPGEAMAFAHAQIAANHAHVREAHEQIRRHHEDAAARLHGLIEVVEGEGTSDHRVNFGDRTYCASLWAKDTNATRLSCPGEGGEEVET